MIVDAIRYAKRSGDVDVVFQTIYDRHRGSYKDDNAVDFRNVWNLNLGTKYRDHDLYMGIYGQDESDLASRRFGTLAIPVLPLVNGAKTSDKRWDVEFGSKGPIGNNGHWDYDLGFVYTNYEADVVNNVGAAGDFISPEMQGWMGHVAVKWDSKKEWAAKLAFTMADDESVGAIALDNDQRYQDGIETPYEDISRGNNYFRNGLMNMTDVKLQAEYRPRNSKHYFRLAGDFLNEMDETVSNDLAKFAQGEQSRALYAANAANNRLNSAYDRWNNFRISDAEAMVLTFEYRYQLAENTRIKVGYTNFEFLGDAHKFDGVGKIAAGRGMANDFDYDMLWAEIYSRF